MAYLRHRLQLPDLVPTPKAEALARQTWLAHVGDQASFNRDLAKILADAAKDGERIILQTIGDGVGAEVRRAQYKIAVAQLQQLSTQMWTGAIDPLITQHVALSTDRAVDGLMAIDRVLAQSLANPVLRDSFLAAARNGADNVRSRLLNNIRLSPQVYQTQALANHWVAQEVNRGIALNKSAKEIAQSVRKFIRPDVRGGVSYAAQRLGRTELNNAFHTTTIRATADMPWVTGYLWHTSGSHPEPDECDQFASEDHDGLGPGIFSKGNAPGKPHPQCLCYITTINVDEEEFANSLLAGKYDKFLTDNGFVEHSLPSIETQPIKKASATAKTKPKATTQSPLQQAVSKLNAGKKNPALPDDLREGIHRWTAGSDDFAMKLKDVYATGKPATDPAAKALMDAINASDPTTINLYRGVRLRDFDAESFSDLLVVGKEVDLPMASWTSGRDMADQFALLRSAEVRSLTMEVRPGVQALRIDTTSSNIYGATQKEWIAQGKMKVVNRVVDERGNIHVILEPA